MKVLYLDTETTGPDTAKDDVIELGTWHDHAEYAAATGLDDAQMGRVWRFKPTVPISAGATAVHGITDADVADSPTFVQKAQAVADELASADVIVGYNLDFDLQILEGEFKRAGRDWPVRPETLRICVFKLWKMLEPRDLKSAHRRFAGGEFEGAHGASADAGATRRVLVGMVFEHVLERLSWEELATRADPEHAKRFGPSNHLRWDGPLLCITFGKHTGKALTVLALNDSNYLRWISTSGTFPAHVAEACKKVLALSATAFHEWARGVK